MSIQLTEKAAEEIRKIIGEQGLDPQTQLRVGVKGYGPQRSYSLDLTETPEPEDETVTSHGIAVSFSKKDASALDAVTVDYRDQGVGGSGFTFSVPTKQHVTRGPGDGSGQPGPTEEKILEALHQVDDPEVGVNIVDLGLIYGLDIKDRNVDIRMTMTTPACPLSEQIRAEVDERIREVCPGVDAIQIEVVWSPPWSSDMMTPEGKRQLGWSR